MKKIRAAVIGVGYLGKFHAQKYKNNAQVELLGVCDSRKENAQEVAASLGVRAFFDINSLLAEKPDCVTVATSTQAHYEVAKICLQAGIHVNVEKPMTATLDQAKDLVKVAKEKSLCLAVGHIERFNPVLRALKEKLKDTKFLELYRHAPFKVRGADVSVLHDLMIHDLDLALWLTNSEFKEIKVCAQKVLTQEYDVASVFGQMKNGTFVHISVDRIAQNTRRQVRAVESDCTLLADSGTMEIQIGQLQRVGELAMNYTTQTVAKEDALQLETNAFVEAILNGSPAKVSGEDGLRAMELIELIQKQLSRV